MNDDGLRRDYFRLFGISKDEFERRLGKIGFGDCYKLKVMSDGLKVEFSYQKFESATYGLIESRFAAEFKNEIYALRDIGLKEQFIDVLKLHGIKVSVAESFTGGALSAAITAFPGASKVFYEGIVAYNEEAKAERLGVKRETLEYFHPVSKEVAAEMAQGLLRERKADLAISTTGIAGPKSDGSGSPIGLCFIGVSYMGETQTYKYMFSGDRNDVIRKGVNAAIFRALKFITREVVR